MKIGNFLLLLCLYIQSLKLCFFREPFLFSGINYMLIFGFAIKSVCDRMKELAYLKCRLS